MITETAAKKDIQKLQRAIVDGLEDVKAQDIQVFDTEHLSALFERVIVASGTSNRQTKALASSVRDAVRDAGFAKPRMEGEANGEWIIVDCGQAVVHIMQPSFRQYYHLEELWGEKPVRLKFGSVKPALAEPTKPAKEVKAAPKVPTDIKRSNAAKKGVAEAFPSKAQLKKTEQAKSAAAKAPAKRVVAKKAPAKTTIGKTTVGKTAASKTASPTKVTVNAPTKVAVKKVAAKKAPAKKAPARKA
jgi:ribosome-associated protein